MEGITSYARSRFISVLCLAIAGAVLAVGAFVFRPEAERWLGVGIGGGCELLLLSAFATRGRGTLQRLLDAVAVPVAAWSVVSALVIEQGTAGPVPHLVRWLGFSAGAAVAVLGLIGLIAHEISVEQDLGYATERIWGLTPHLEPENADAFSHSVER